MLRFWSYFTNNLISFEIRQKKKVKNTLLIGNIFPYIEEKITPNIGKKLPTKQYQYNNTNTTTTNSKKFAVVAAVNFKKLKRERRMIWLRGSDV